MLRESQAEQQTQTPHSNHQYLDELLHIPIKEHVVIKGARSGLPHFLRFGGETRGPEENGIGCQ